METRAADVLDFLIRFLDEHLLERLTDDDMAAIDDDMAEIREGLSRIKAYVRSRMDRLRGELSAVADHTVQCPDCRQFALVVDGMENGCRFCPRSWDFEEAASSYASEILSFSWHDLTEGGAEPLVQCPECETETLVLGASTAASPDGTVNICFNCAQVLTGLESCSRCGRVYIPDDQETVCSWCMDDLVSRD